MSQAPVNRSVNIYLNSGEAEAAQERLKKKSEELKKKIEEINNANKQVPEELKNQFDKVTKQLDNVNKKISGEFSPSVKDLAGVVKKLRAEMNLLSKEDPGFSAKAEQLREAEKQLAKATLSIKGLKDGFKSFAKEVKTIALGVLIGNSVESAISAVAGYFSGILSGATKLSDSLADIKKTTGLTTEEVKKLNSQFGNIDTRTSTSALRDIAVVAGQLGIAKENLLDFVKAIDVANVALADEFGGNAEEVAQILGSLRNVLTDAKTGDVANDLLRIGNALNVLGSEGAATAPVVADFANRIGGVGITLGLTSGQVLGLSATLQELNVNTERGGTAVVKILQKITTDSAKFASVAGMGVEDFTNLVNTDLLGALQAVAQGSRESAASATAFGAILDELGVDGAGASEVFSKLGGNIGLLNEKVDLANNSLRFTTSLTEEFNTKNTTLAATVDKLDKQFRALVSGSGINSFFTGIVNAAAGFIETLRGLPGFISKNAVAFIALGTAVAVYYSRLIATTVATIANTTVEKAANLVRAISAGTTGAQTAATTAYNTIIGVLTGRIKIATALQMAYNAVLALNPFGLVLAGIGATIAAIKLYSDNTKEAIALEKAKRDLEVSLKTTLDELDAAQDSINEKLKDFNNLSVEQKKNLLEEIRLKKESAIASLAKAEAEQESIKKQSAQATIFQQAMNYLATGGNIGLTVIENLKDANKNSAEAAGQFTEKINKLKEEIKEFGTVEEQVSASVEAFDKAMKISTDTTAGLQEKQRLLQLAVNNSKRGSDEYIKAQQELLKVQKELGKSNTTISGTDTEKEKKKLEDFVKELAKIRAELEQADMNNDEREIARVIAKYDVLRKEAGKNKVLLLQVEELYQKELKQLQEKQFLSTSDKEFKASIAASNLYFEELKQSYKKQYAQGLIDKQQYDLLLQQTEIDSAKVRIQIAEDYVNTSKEAEKDLSIFKSELTEKELELQIKLNEQRKQNEQKLIEDLKKISADKDLGRNTRLDALAQAQALEMQAFKGTEEEKTKLLEEYTKKRNEINTQAVQGFVERTAELLNTGLDIIGNINSIIANRNDAELAADKKLNDEKKVRLDKQLKDKRISEEQYQKKIEAIELAYEKKKADLKKKQFQREKAANIIQAIINTAVGVTKAIPNVPLMVLSGIAGATQVAAIASQPVPEFAKGTYLEGPLHRDGGMPIMNPRTGKKVAEVEGGEIILSRATVRNNPEATSRLLYASMYEGGKRVYDLIPALKENRHSINYTRVFENIRYEKGGTITPSFSNDNDASVQLLKQQNALLLSILEQNIKLNQKEFGISYQALKKADDTVSFIQSKQL